MNEEEDQRHGVIAKKTYIRNCLSIGIPTYCEREAVSPEKSRSNHLAEISDFEDTVHKVIECRVVCIWMRDQFEVHEKVTDLRGNSGGGNGSGKKVGVEVEMVDGG